MKTGAYRKAPGTKGRLGGRTERPVSILMPESQVRQAEAEFATRMRLLSRKYTGSLLAEERARLQAEMQAKLTRQRPNTPVKQSQTPPVSPFSSGSPYTSSSDTSYQDSPLTSYQDSPLTSYQDSPLMRVLGRDGEITSWKSRVREDRHREEQWAR